jgi:hypothetical protein
MNEVCASVATGTLGKNAYVAVVGTRKDEAA